MNITITISSKYKDKDKPLWDYTLKIEESLNLNAVIFKSSTRYYSIPEALAAINKSLFSCILDWEIEHEGG